MTPNLLLPPWMRYVVGRYLGTMASGPNYLTQVLIESATVSPALREARIQEGAPCSPDLERDAALHQPA